MKTIHFVSIILVLNSCFALKKPNSTTKQIINDFKNSDISKIRFDGAYQFKWTPPPRDTLLRPADLYRPIYFFRNGLVFYDGVTWYDINECEKWAPTYYTENGQWGVYAINGNILNISLYFEYAGLSFKNHSIQTTFQAVIKNQDTILSWKALKPLPRFPEIDDRKASMLIPEDLSFISVPFRAHMDSVSDRVWLNKYKQ